MQFSQDTFLEFMTDALKRKREEVFLAMTGQICTGTFSIINVLMDLNKVKRKAKGCSGSRDEFSEKMAYYITEEPRCVDREVLNLYCYNEGEKEGTVILLMQVWGQALGPCVARI